MASAPTMSDVLEQLTALLGVKNLKVQQELAIDTGTDTGGPNGDGYYPFEAPDGTIILLPSRRKLTAMALQGVATRAALAALNSGVSAYLTEIGVEGRWRLTTADISAGVTVDPHQMVYVPFALDATGANGGWVRVLSADDPIDTGWGVLPGGDLSTVLNSAIVLATVTKAANAKRARRVLVRPNRYYWNSVTTLTGYDVIIDARGAEIVQTVGGIARTYHAGWKTIVVVTAAVPIGARTITLTDASAFKRNDVIKLVSDDRDFGNRAGAVVNGVQNDYWQGECAVVKSVDLTANTITLMGPIVSGAFQTNVRVALYADRVFELTGGDWRAWTLEEGAPIAIKIASQTGVGNGALGTNPASSQPAKAPYVITFSNGTAFTVKDATGALVGGAGTVGTAFSAGGLSFTLNAGTTAFAAGDTVTLGPSGWSSMVSCQFQWRAYRKSRVRHWESSCNYAQGLWFCGCYDVLIDAPVAGNYANIQGNSNQNGYITFPSNSEKFIVRGGLFGTCRHAFTTNVDRVPPGSDPSSYGACRNGEVSNCIGQGAAQCHFDTHHGAQDIKVIGCRSIDAVGEDGEGGGGGFSARGFRIKFISCEVDKAYRAFNAQSEAIPAAEYTDTVEFVDCTAKRCSYAAISVRNATNIIFSGKFDGEATGLFVGEFINKNSVRNLGVIRLKALSTAGATTYAVRLQDTVWDNRGGRLEIDTTAVTGGANLASMGMFGTTSTFTGGEVHHFLPTDGSVPVTCSKLATDTADYAPDVEYRYNYDGDIHGAANAPSFFKRGFVGGSYTGQSNYISVNIGAATAVGRNKPQWLQTALPDGSIVSRASDDVLYGHLKVDGTDTLGDQLDPGAKVGQQAVLSIVNQTGSTGGSIRWVAGATMSFSGTIVGVAGDIIVFEWTGAVWQPVNRQVQRVGPSFVPVLPTTSAAVTNVLNQGSGRETFITDNLPGDCIIQLPPHYTNETWSFYRSKSSGGPGNLVIQYNGATIATLGADATNGAKALIHNFGGTLGYQRIDIG